MRSQSPAAAKHPFSVARTGIDPHFVRVRGTLREGMAEPHGADDGFEQVFLASLQGRNLRTQRCQQFPVNRPALLYRKQINSQAAFKEFLMTSDNVRLAAQVRDAGVRSREKMIVDAQRLVRRIEELRAKITARLQRHVAACAILLRLLRVVESACVVTRHPAQEISVVMILAAEEVLVLRHVVRQADLVARRAEFRRAHDRLEKGLLVKLRLRLHQLVVHVLQHAIGAVGERIVNRFIDRVIGVAHGGIHMRDGMAGCASDARFRRGMMIHIEVGIIKRAAEERHHVMAAGAPARSLHVSIALEGDASRFLHAEQVGRVVERAKVMRAVEPALVGVGVALEAIVIHHQRLRRDEFSRSRPGQ